MVERGTIPHPDFLAAWKAWDESCIATAANGRGRQSGPDPLKSERMEQRAKPIAEMLGLEVSVFRALLADWRRAGFSRERALAAVEAGVLA